MAEFKIYLTADTKSAIEGIGKVEKSLKSYRNTIIDNQSDTTKLTEAEQNYYNALNKQLGLIDTLKDGKAGLVDKLKLLKTEQYQFNSALGSGNKYSEQYQKAIDEVNTNLAKYKTAATDASAKTNVLGLKFASVVINFLKFQVVLKIMNSVKTVLKESTQAAAEAEQVFSKLSTVFAGLEDSASSAAEKLSTSIGVAKSTAASALSTVADMLQAQGMGTAESLQTATEWVEKFQDIIAFKDVNMTLEEFATNFMSGATGNLRNFRTFGSIVKESTVQTELAKKGLDSLSGSQLNLAKMVTRAEMALEQQANAIGATGREWETTQSITRRYDEANKQLKENIGDAINTKLNPLKALWADIAEQINKATEAQKEYNNGVKNIKVYDIVNDADDKKSFKQTIQGEVIAPRTAAGGRYANDTTTYNQLVAIMTKYQASAEQVKEIWKDIPDSIYTALQAYEQLLAEQREHETLLSNLSATWTSVSEEAADLVAQLEEVKGVDTGLAGTGINNLLKVDSPTTEAGLDDLSKKVELKLGAAIENAISSFDSTSWESFVSSIDLAFGEATETEGLSEKLNALKSLYSIIYTYAVKDGEITLEEKGYLNAILNIYDGILARQKEITDETKRQTEFEEQKKNFLSTTQEYQKQQAQLYMSDNEKALDDLKRSYDAIDTTGWSDLQIRALNDAYEESKQALISLQAEQEKYNAQLAEEEKTKKAIEDENNKKSSFLSYSDNAAIALEQFDMTDREKAINNLVREFHALSEESQKELLPTFQSQLAIINRLYDKQDTYNKKLEDEAAAKERLSTLDSQRTSFVNLKTSNELAIEQFGMSDYEKAMDNLDRSYAALDPELQKELKQEYEYQKSVITEIFQLQDEYNAKLEEEAKAKEKLNNMETASSAVTSSTEALNATIASNAKRDELEAQYTDSLSYMVDILMQEYEYEQEYAELLQNLITAGYTEDEATAQLVGYKDAYGKIIQRLIKKGEEEANKPDTTARDNALKSAQEGTANYQKQLRQLYMSEPQKTIDDLSENLGKYDEEVDEAINKQIQAYEELYNAQQKYTKELENAEAWKALGQNALSSFGTVGGAINTIAYGDGDIWTRILEVCLDIFQQSEYFAEIVALIDKLIEPILPIVEAIFYTISSLEPMLEPLMFVLKVIASLITEVLFVVNMIIDIFEWFWDNLKIALKNVAVDVYNLFHLRKKDREDYKALTDYWGETIAQTNAILEKIWNKVPTNDDADFSTLENLLKSGIINLDQYNAGLRVQQKDMIFDPVAPVEYIASTPQGETTIKYGDVTVVINGGSKEEIQSVLINVMRKAGYDVSNVPITA